MQIRAIVSLLPFAVATFLCCTSFAQSTVVINKGEKSCLYDYTEFEACPDKLSIICPDGQKCELVVGIPRCFDHATEEFSMYDQIPYAGSETMVLKWIAPPTESQNGYTAKIVATIVCYERVACWCLPGETSMVCTRSESWTQFVLRDFRQDLEDPCTGGGIIP